jgi:hypothetical protein
VRFIPRGKNYETSGASLGGMSLSLSSERDRRSRRYVTIGGTIQGSDKTVAAT